jgi:hypothetical protein
MARRGEFLYLQDVLYQIYGEDHSNFVRFFHSERLGFLQVVL